MKINRFMANIDNMTRQNMFEVDIFCPAIDLRLRGIRCQKAVLPGKTFEVVPFNEVSSGPNRSYITKVSFPQDIAFTFLCDTHFEDKMKLELWQNYMYGEDYSIRYPKSGKNGPGYEGKVIIRQMDKSDLSVYEVELLEAFPQVIAAQTLDMTSAAVQTFDVTFGYRTWFSSFEYPPENNILSAIFKQHKRRIISRTRRKIEDKLLNEKGTGTEKWASIWAAAGIYKGLGSAMEDPMSLQTKSNWKGPLENPWKDKE